MIGADCGECHWHVVDTTIIFTAHGVALTVFSKYFDNIYLYKRGSKWSLFFVFMRGNLYIYPENSGIEAPRAVNFHNSWWKIAI